MAKGSSEFALSEQAILMQYGERERPEPPESSCLPRGRSLTLPVLHPPAVLLFCVLI